MTDETKRRRTGAAGSVLLHLGFALALSLTGWLSVTGGGAPADIVYFDTAGGGGGGGGSGGEAPPAAESEPDTEEEAAEDTAETPEADAIGEPSDRERPKPAVHQTTRAPAARAAGTQAGSGGGSGGGAGTGSGKGTGGGTGSGSGGGSGSGSGGGHGSGEGAGSGDPNAITASPAVPPRILRSVPPPYPAAEKNAGVEGTTVVRCLIDQDGGVEAASVLTSSGSAALDEAAVDACRRWRFSSAKNAAGRPVRCYASIPVSFKIRR